MSNDSDTFIKLEINLKASQTEFLIGLDNWLQLGLIEESQVKSLCQNYLTCALPEVETEAISSEVKPIRSQSNLRVRSQSFLQQKLKHQNNIVRQIWQAFLDELSIRWLLFLGIFLVIISSGVLAATQWHNFPKIGQYLILLTYTLSFWLVGFWLNKQDDLRLTSQSLKSIAILLVPINFWGISRFGLGNNIKEWLIIAIAALSLTIITYREYSTKPQYIRWSFVPIFLLLSYFHLGWHLSYLPIWTIYIGIIVIASTTYYFSRKLNYNLKLLLFLLSTWFLLVFRFLLQNNSLTSLGLGFSICGWLLAIVDLNRSQTNRSGSLATFLVIKQFLEITGLLLLFCGGFFAGVIWFDPVKWYPWQAIAVCSLTLHLFSSRLQIYWRKLDLLFIFLIGLRTIFLLKELIPIQLRENFLNLSVTITQTELFPESVYSITLFPYLLLFVVIINWLSRREKPQLASFGEGLGLGFGIILTSLSWNNPVWRSLNLCLSTATLYYLVSNRQLLRIGLVYFTHALGLITLYSLIDWWFSPQNQEVWSIIFLITAIAEWAIYLLILKNRQKPRTIRSKTWHHSYWHLGLFLTTISYVYLFKSNSSWGLIWLLTPLMLTVIAVSDRQKRLVVACCSCVALVLVQYLTLNNYETRLISLSVATGLMFINSFYLRRTILAALHIGFALSLIISLLWQNLAFFDWLLTGSLVINLLYSLARIISSQRIKFVITSNKLRKKYALAIDYWAITLISLELVILTVLYLNFAFSNLNTRPIEINWQYFLSSLLISSAIWFRYRQQLTPKILYALAWTIELSVFSLIILIGGASLAIATSNIILAFLSLRLIDWLSSQSFPIARLPNLNRLSILYLILGILWRLPYFTATTGLISLGAALTGIGIGSYPGKENKTISYLSLAGITFAIYELAIYQIIDRSPEITDPIAILASIAAVIAFCYRILVLRWRQQSLFNFSLNQILITAHWHWAIASSLTIIAAVIEIETNTSRLSALSIGISLCLSLYAILQAKSQQRTQATINRIEPSQNNDWWVYVGLAEIIATIIYSRLIIPQLSIFDPWYGIFTCLISLTIDRMPWQNLGWRLTPWRRTALVMPISIALITAATISYFSLLATATFYIWIAYERNNLRWAYFSLGLIDWVMLRYFWQSSDPIWFASVIGLSCLFIAQIDPQLQQRRQLRHYFRLFGSSVICLTALIKYQQTGIIPIAIALVFILIGLGFRIRAFLYLGTITFILTIIYQLVILIFTYSFLKWIVGLIAGIIAIAIAANFERKSNQIANKLQNYLVQLQQWQ